MDYNDNAYGLLQECYNNYVQKIELLYGIY